MKATQIRGPNKMVDLKERSKWAPRGAPEDPALRRTIVGATVQVAIQALFGGFTHTFNGKIYCQQGGGPTGTRFAMAVGQVLMEFVLDKMRTYFWNTDKELEMELIDLILYEYDGRAFLNTMSWDYRFLGDRFGYLRTAYEENKKDNRDPKDITNFELLKAYNSLSAAMKFTVDRREDYDDGYIPTIDFKLKKVGKNRFIHTFFE